MTPVAVPVAMDIDRNNKSIATPLTLPAAARMTHFLCLLFINQVRRIRHAFFP